MSIEAIAFIPPSQEIFPGASTEASISSEAPGNFAPWLEQQLTQVNQQLIDSDSQLRGLALGQVDNLHQVMISLEKAKLSFQLVLQVRNHLLEAYQDIIRMQI
ncbi:MAG TPA: flagellar hook-basal body complex protein FliE [Acidiferrobacterales bacterium]|nr:flagellar hook-basal body complex protein FliE [Acidiferrobacterales bacterium]